MNTNNPLFQFLQELFLRFSAKSPTFFKIWQLISSILVAVTGLPDFLQMFGITLPAPWNALESKAVAFAAAGVLFMSLLTTQSKVTSKTEDGALLKKTDETKLPFTASQEAVAVTKKEATGVTIPTVDVKQPEIGK